MLIDDACRMRMIRGQANNGIAALAGADVRGRQSPDVILNRHEN
jgi:hypothetical protein